MCRCKNVQLGTYKNIVDLKVPDSIKLFRNNNKRERIKSVSVDKCLAEEIKYLWGLGIGTTGCCCGHNLVVPYIGVNEEDILKMSNMGSRILHFQTVT